MTKLGALIKARDMWEWLRDNPEASKIDYFVDSDIGPIPYNTCYLCEYCKDPAVDEEGDGDTCVHCENCPVQWLTIPQIMADELYCCDRGSPYRDWGSTDNYQKKADLAQKIVDLINEGIERAEAEEEESE